MDQLLNVLLAIDIAHTVPQKALELYKITIFNITINDSSSMYTLIFKVMYIGNFPQNYDDGQIKYKPDW